MLSRPTERFRSSTRTGGCPWPQKCNPITAKKKSAAAINIGHRARPLFLAARTKSFPRTWWLDTVDPKQEVLWWNVTESPEIGSPPTFRLFEHWNCQTQSGWKPTWSLEVYKTGCVKNNHVHDHLLRGEKCHVTASGPHGIRT